MRRPQRHGDAGRDARRRRPVRGPAGARGDPAGGRPPKLIRGALNGYGTVANDILGTGDPLYVGDDLGQRARDLDNARGLLRRASFDLSRSYELFTTTDETSAWSRARRCSRPR